MLTPCSRGWTRAYLLGIALVHSHCCHFVKVLLSHFFSLNKSPLSCHGPHDKSRDALVNRIKSLLLPEQNYAGN